MVAWEEGMFLDDVSISAEDKLAGSPKEGDMIARNPKNHNDQWLVAKQYFEDNLEAIDKDATWMDRLVTEHNELLEKLTALTKALDEGNVPDSAKAILTEQQAVMKEYASILYKRIKG